MRLTGRISDCLGIICLLMIPVLGCSIPQPVAEHAGTAAVVKPGETEGSIDIASFINIIETAPERILLIDVRDPDEYAAGHLKTAINIPLDELEEKIATLPPDKTIVFVCTSGARAGESYFMVQDLRPMIHNVYYLEADCIYHKDGSYTIKKHE